MHRSHLGPTSAARRPFLALIAFAAIAAAAAGCGSPDKAPPKTAAGAGAKVAPPAPIATAAAVPKGDTETETRGSVHIDDRIVKACGGLPTAHFAFDSASIDPGAGHALDALARCFVDGPLKDSKGMRLVGHADPRGETEYNVGLGQQRAGSVARYLGQKGLEHDRLKTTSKGAFEATGTDEAGWALDRKVDVLLLD
jgi:peptidoglycan-associated lipoprotein